MNDWQHRVDAVWQQASALGDDEVIKRIDALAAERPADEPVALFERAGARDSAGLEAQAELLYRAALAGGLSGPERVQAYVQLASTIRNLGRPLESIASTRSSPTRASCATRWSRSVLSRSSTRATPGARHPTPSRPSLPTCRATACRSPRTPQSSRHPPRANSPIRVRCTG
ncbi:tetratricopeptide repeat protein [Agromyces albus]|uniref:tetratricopeptide repeat protein n=1 Tax=Agromyces albus TaxID=205332 RepID=UPI00277E9C4E|nr:hypothetical protein [Agromyces albus]